MPEADPDRPADAAAAVPRPAATVVLLRPGPDGPEVLLTRRPSTMAFGPGLHVFPGGALDEADGDPALLERLAERASPLVAESHGDRFAIAAIREAYEEVGILLATGPDGDAIEPASSAATSAAPFAELVERLDLRLRSDWLAPLSRWVTPPPSSRRYDTRFFVAALPEGASVDPEPHEVAEHRWLTPRDALAAMAAGTIELWPPTSTTLGQLADARDLDDVRRHLSPVERWSPPVIDLLSPAVARVGFGGAGAIPGQAVEGYLVGRSRLVIVDPGDPSDEAAEGLLAHAGARGAEIAAILLTAPVPDHAAGAETLAHRLGIPVLASAGASRALSTGIVEIEDADRIGFADVEIRVHATPGTHPDHLAFELPAEGVVLVGDLEGPGASRAIPERVDEHALARSRQLVERIGGRRLAAHR